MATKPKTAAPPAGDDEAPKPRTPRRRNRWSAAFSAPDAALGLEPARVPQAADDAEAHRRGWLWSCCAGGGGELFPRSGAPADEHAEGGRQEASSRHGATPSELPSEHAAFFDVPDIVVNIQTADSTPAYLKLAVALELDSAEARRRDRAGDAARDRPVPDLSARAPRRGRAGLRWA